MPIPIGAYDPSEGTEVVSPSPGWDPYVPPKPGETGTNTGPTTTQPLTVDQLADALKKGKYTAGDLDWLQANGLLPESVRQAAQIQKDAWLHRGGAGWGGMGNNAAWQQAFAQNPDLNQIDWQKWAEMLGYVWPAEYSPDQPTLQFNPAALPNQYRQGAQSWFKSQGLRPTGSLGQYGYTQYQRAQGQPYKPLELSLFEAIPDPNLRAWMLWYASKAGLIKGSFEKPMSQ